jgi:hypothetical protein
MVQGKGIEDFEASRVELQGLKPMCCALDSHVQVVKGLETPAPCTSAASGAQHNRWSNEGRFGSSEELGEASELLGNGKRDGMAGVQGMVQARQQEFRLTSG